MNEFVAGFLDVRDELNFHDLEAAAEAVSKKRKPKQQAETILSKAIRDWIHAKGGWAVRVNSRTIMIPDKRGGRYPLKANSQEGCPDILACVPMIVKTDAGSLKFGLMVAIEVKTDKGKPSPKQESCHERIKKANGIVIIAYSLADVEEALPWL